MSSGKPKTTFLTKEPNRAASAYHVDEHGATQRARQEHDHGPTLTSRRQRVQAFVPSKEMAHTVAKIVSDDSQRLNVSPDFALRMAIMDGLAKPTVQANMGHLEASGGGVGRGNPHVSGGLTKFPVSGSRLENFREVAQQTQASRQHWEQSGHTEQFEPIHGRMSEQITPAAQEFNQRALEDQRRFAAAILKPPVRE